MIARVGDLQRRWSHTTCDNCGCRVYVVQHSPKRLKCSGCSLLSERTPYGFTFIRRRAKV